MQTIKRLPAWGVYALLVYMPFHIFLTQWLSLATGGLSVWKVGKDIITIGLLLLTLFFAVRRRLYNNQLFLLLLLASTVYLLFHTVTYQGTTTRNIAALAEVYNNRVFWYALIGLGAALLWPEEFKQSQLIRVILILSTVVCVLGILQYMLPKDIMTNFGYSVERGVKPAFFIDDKPDLPRIMSTIRDPNSLGGYLAVPIALLTYLFFKARTQRRPLILSLLLLHGVALFLTFSRSAWLAVLVSELMVVFFVKKEQIMPFVRRFWLVGLAALVLLASVVYLGRDQYVVQNVVFHSDESTTSKLDSNEYHATFMQLGLQGIAKKPLGHGPGTAGIVSIQNKDGGLLTENYYIQIGYEVGVVGLLLFLSVLFLVYEGLSKQKPSALQVTLLATFWGYAVMAMLTHLWTNETIAAQWWLLAGVVMSTGGVAAIRKKSKKGSSAAARDTK